MELIIGGDLNTYLNEKIDKQGKKIDTQSKYAINWTNLMENFNLSDKWRIRNPQIKRYTWRSNTRNGIAQSRLDYFIISRSLEYSISDTDIKPGLNSDHSIITITIKFNNYQKRGKGLWKLNCKLLTDEQYIERMKAKIDDTKLDSKNIQNLHIRWDFIKGSIRSECINYSIEKAKLEKT